MSDTINKLCVELLSQPIFAVLFTLGIIYVIYDFLKVIGFDMLKVLFKLIEVIFSLFKQKNNSEQKIINKTQKDYSATKIKENQVKVYAKNLCPICGRKLVKKNGKYGNFYGCTSFPKCKYTQDIKDINEENN